MAGLASIPRWTDVNVSVFLSGRRQRGLTGTDTGLGADDQTFVTVSELLDRRWVYIPKGQSQLVGRPVLISSSALV